MAKPKLSDEELQRTMDSVARHAGNQTHAAKELGLPRATVQARIIDAERRGIKGRATSKLVSEEKYLRNQIRELTAQIAASEKNSLTDEYVRRKIIGLSEAAISPPNWSYAEAKKSISSPGIPMTIWSDWHYGERVFPSQVNGVNKYDLKIAHNRTKRLVERTVDLLTNHMVNPKYPGMIVLLAGDLVSGGIHDELAATDELPIMPIVIDVVGVLMEALSILADKFGRLWVVVVSGNHGRNTKKIWAKHRNYTNFDWLIGQMLAKHFEKDKRVTFTIPDGPDAHVNVFGHRYLLTHGDRLGKGGDGIIGSAGPIIRGTMRKQARDSQIDLPFDTLVHGHFHQLSQTQRIIGNGSMIGYSEYAYTEGFAFEIPQQALWLHHQVRGITCHWPVQLEDKKAASQGKYGANPVTFGRMGEAA